MTNKNMFIRNEGYVDKELQNKIFNAKVLLAGCGLGSYIGEALIRIGCHHIILVDQDTVDEHNLNRQDFTYQDIGELKTESLKKRLLHINPQAQVECINTNISAENADAIVSKVDIVVDTIDFLSVSGLLSLYDACHLQKKPIISSLSAGWGAVAFHVPATQQTQNWFKNIFNISDIDNSDPKEYAYYFNNLITRIRPYLSPDVAENISHVVSKMIENKPCPASQISVGAMAAASLCTTLFCRVLANKDIVKLPFAMAIDMNDIAQREAFPIGTIDKKEEEKIVR